MKANEYGVKAIGVRSLSIDKLKPNPHNPRMLFDRADLHVLRESIKRVGIDRKSTRLNSSHSRASRMPSSA